MKFTATTAVVALSALSMVGAAPIPPENTFNEAELDNIKRVSLYNFLSHHHIKEPVHVPPPKQAMDKLSVWDRQRKNERIAGMFWPTRPAVPAVDMDVQNLNHVSHAYGNVDKAFDVGKSFLQSFHL